MTKIIKSQNEIARELGISKAYLSDVLNGKQSCYKELKNKLLKYYPNLKFKEMKRRYVTPYRVEKVDEIDE